MKPYRRRGGICVVALALSISACVSTVSGEDAGGAQSWEVAYELSGGIAGTMKQMTVYHDGRVTAENLRRHARIEKRLSADQVRELGRLVERAESAPEVPRSPSGRCADCMRYQVTVTRSEGRPTFSEDGLLEERRSRSPELVAFLTAVLNEAVQP